MIGKWIQVFKTGTHTDSSGNTKTWTKDDLDLIVNAYSKNQDVPFVIGHPKTDSPAYGWIDGIKREGEFLYVKAKEAVEEFVDMVKKGMFKKRSISVNPDGTLNHIGWLGAKAPAVKGLEDFKFNADNAGLVYEYEAEEKVDKPAVVTDPATNTPPAPSQEGSKKTLAEYQQDIERLTTEITQLKKDKQDFASADEKRVKAETELSTLRLRIRKAEFETYLNEKIAYGSVSPAMEKKITKLLEVLDSVQFANGEEPVEFSFSEGEPELPVMIFKSLIDDMPKQVEFTEHATKKDRAKNLDMEDHQAIADAATEFVQEQAKLGKTVTYSYAVAQVTKNKK